MADHKKNCCWNYGWGCCCGAVGVYPGEASQGSDT